MNEQAFVMTSDQRRCIQRSRFVCGILVFFVMKQKELRCSAGACPVPLSAVTAASFVVGAV